MSVPDEAGLDDAATRVDYDYGSGGNGTHPHRGERPPRDQRNKEEGEREG